jgi:DNA-binding NtrC family response regulator
MVIPELVNHFIERFCVHEDGVAKTISDNALEQLINRNWPGNVRELENMIHRSMVMSDKNVLHADDFNEFGSVEARMSLDEVEKHPKEINLISENGGFKDIDAIEKEVMSKALEHYNHNITNASQALGMAKSTFYKKMKHFKL